MPLNPAHCTFNGQKKIDGLNWQKNIKRFNGGHTFADVVILYSFHYLFLKTHVLKTAPLISLKFCHGYVIDVSVLFVSKRTGFSKGLSYYLLYSILFM